MKKRHIHPIHVHRLSKSGVLRMLFMKEKALISVLRPRSKPSLPKYMLKNKTYIRINLSNRRFVSSCHSFVFPFSE